MNASDFGTAWNGKRKASGGFMCKCPAHADSTGSLSVDDGEKGVIFKCFAGCDTARIIEAAKAQGLWKKKTWNEKVEAGDRSRIVAEYEYVDQDGNLIYQACRFEPKKFIQRRPDYDKGTGWIWDMKGITRVLYRLPAVLTAAKAGEVVVVVEGEKDVHTLEEMGFVATCNVGGAGKWEPQYTDQLKGAKVIICQDNDQAGQDHALLVARYLTNAEIGCKILALPDLPPKGDVTDWRTKFKTYHDAQAKFIELCAAAPIWQFPLAEPAEKQAQGEDADTMLVSGGACVDTNIFGQNFNTDMANAVRLRLLCGNDLRYTGESGYHVWDGKRFQRDITQGLVTEKAKAVARSIYVEQGHYHDPQLSKWAKQSQMLPRLNAMIHLCRSERGIPAHITDFDNSRRLICAQNGVIDLDQGELLPFDQKFMFSRILPVDFNPKATCPKWLEFLSWAMSGDQEMIDYMQTLFGYCLTAETSEQSLFFFYGEGNNGKSIVIEILSALMGEYGANTPTSSLMRKEQKGIPNDIARLRGLRFVSANETTQGQKLDEALVKDLTGNDTITARFLHGEFFDFEPSFKLVMRGNHKPRISGNDKGIWRRIDLVDFRESVAADKKNKYLKQELISAELEGILAWAVAGAVGFCAHGLPEPTRVTKNRDEYREEMDIIGAFLNDCVSEVSDDGITAQPRLPAKTLYQAYQWWCKENGHREVSNTQLGLLLGQRGIQKHRLTVGWHYLGLTLKAEIELEIWKNRKGGLGAQMDVYSDYATDG